MSSISPTDIDWRGPSEAERRARLNRMKAFATALLVLMAVLFVVTKIYEPLHPAIGYARAFSEAAMIGALADWFAVTALFRHPLGLPIPHTAIVRRRKNEIGRSLARFVRDHFLVREAVVARLSRADFASRMGRWLEREENAEALTRDAGRLVGWLLDAVDSQALRDSVRAELGEALSRAPATPAMGALLNTLVADRHAQQLLDVVVRSVREVIIANQDRIRARIDEESPWWLPRFVDEQIFEKIVAEIMSWLDRIGDDGDTEARQQFLVHVGELVERLKTDEALIARGEALKAELLAHPAVRDYVDQLWLKLRMELAAQARNPDSALRRRLLVSLADLGKALRRDPDLAQRVNAWLTDAVIYLVENYREQIAGVVSDTVEGWDADETARRVELNIGRDLQFIRINGTLVGGLVGVTIHTVWTVFVGR